MIEVGIPLLGDLSGEHRGRLNPQLRRNKRNMPSPLLPARRAASRRNYYHISSIRVFTIFLEIVICSSAFLR